MTHCRIRFFSALAALALTTNAFALVRVNEGPAFDLESHTNPKYRISQKAFLARYVLWNSAHAIENAGLRDSILVASRKLEKRDFVLPHAELETGFLAFGYKSGPGEYHDWDFLATEFGYCHGMTMVTRNFAYFAKFDPKGAAPYDYAKSPKRWMKFYEKLVDRVMRDETTVIPGFASLTEFSSSPIEIYLERHVADQWGLNTGRISAYRNVYEPNFTPIADAAELRALRKRIENYHAHGFYPRIVLGSGGYSAADPHVVMLTSLEPPAAGSDCLEIGYFNVGMNAGGHPDQHEICVGDRAWIPDDEDLYLYDFAREILKQ